MERRLSRSPVALTASPHKWPGRDFSRRRHMVMSSRDLLRRSATPFHWGVCGGVSSRAMPFEEHNS